jgi:sec-independent protein translocase protein TatB
MFGMGMGELLLILVVALLAVGPDKLPGAAKSIGKAIRDLRRQSKELQTTLEHDSKLGDAVRELKSALHDDPLRPRPAQPPPRTQKLAARPPNTVPKTASEGEPKSPVADEASPADPAAREPDSSAHG